LNETLHIYRTTIPVILPTDPENPDLFPSWHPDTRWIQVCNNAVQYTYTEMEKIKGLVLCEKCVELNTTESE
jgi:hypothetical protein